MPRQEWMLELCSRRLLYLDNNSANDFPPQGRCAELDDEVKAKIEMISLADFILGPLAGFMLFVCFLVEVFSSSLRILNMTVSTNILVMILEDHFSLIPDLVLYVWGTSISARTQFLSLSN